MGLKYRELNEVANDYISINSLTEMFGKLVENDQELLVSLQNKPGIWEKMWYNDNQISGYAKGATVWVNTEVDSELVAEKFETIKQYILNSKYRNQFINISGDATEVNDMFLNVCNGTNGYDRLFYFGDIHEPVQIRMSKVDNNKTLPNNDEFWTDTLRISSANSYTDEMIDMTNELVDVSLSSHLSTYHITDYTWRDITSTYLCNDFSNVQGEQTLITHSIKSRGSKLEGYDRVLRFIRNGKRWFRLWTSGMLEHGGMISEDDASSYISVNFNWEYGNGLVAPSYDHKIVYGGVYSADKLSVGDTTVEINSKNIGAQLTYNIQVSPIDKRETSMINRSAEIFNITNDGFSIVKNSDTKFYSYYTAGFLMQSSVRRLDI